MGPLWVPAFSIAVLAAGLGAEAGARVWYVTPDGAGDAPTIQAAITAAIPGDEVLVAAGSYGWSAQGGDSLALNGPTMLTMRSGVAVRSESGPDVTTIDAEGKGRVVRFEATTGGLIEGFTIRGGNAAHAGPPGHYSKGVGGGILCRYSLSVKIVGNVVRENYSATGGGGIGIVDAHLLIRGNVVSKNFSMGTTGGISVSGGGANVTIEGNTIAENVGGGVFCFDSIVAISQNLILNNVPSALLPGDGVRCYSDSVTLTCNNSWGNPGGDFMCGSGVGNISDDPLVCSGSKDYKLQPRSPCLPQNNGCGLLIGARGECTTTDVYDGRPPRAGLWVAASPNPFHPQTRITYVLRPTVERVCLTVYDLRGRWVVRLVDGQESGTIRSVLWNGKDERGRPAAAGVYIVRLDLGSDTTATKLVLAK